MNIEYDYIIIYMLRPRLFYDYFIVRISQRVITRAVLRLECSLDCISGSPTKYFHFLTVSVSFEIKKM